ncbi:MAG: hypothetical protein WD226_07415 [Planctomycetota bacterium]
MPLFLLLLVQGLDPDQESAWDGMFENFFSPAMAMKLAFIALTAPLWWPIAKVLWSELRSSIEDDSDAFAPAHLSPQAPPKTEGNPWVSIPYAIYRKQGRAGAVREAGRQAQAESQRGSAGAPARRAGHATARRGSGSRGGF